MTALRVLLIVVGFLLLLATALPLIRSERWWIRVCDFPRLQIAVMLLVVFATFLLISEPSRAFDIAFLVALAIAFGYQGYQIFPYTPLASAQVVREPCCEPASRIRLLAANVLMRNRRAADFLALIQASEPDIIMAVETDHWWDERLTALDREYPFSIKHPIDNAYGMHLFSKLELGSPEVRFLVEDDVPSIRTAVRLRSGAWIDFYGVHPRPPRPPRQDTEERDAELLIVGKEVKKQGRPAIVAGDLNDVAWSHTTRLFQRISNTLDPRIGRGPFSTFNAKYPGFRWALDHVFHEASFTLVDMSLLGYFGSDHFPVLIELCHRPRAAAAQETPTADRDDRDEAAEKIRKGQGAPASLSMQRAQ